MTQPRSNVIDLDYTPYYHCISRCVRRAFLCGRDRCTGRSFEHRRQWIVDLIKRLAAMFCIDVPAYAMMHNHYHLVLHVDRERCLALSDREVIRRWLMFHKSNEQIDRYYAGTPLAEEELEQVRCIVDVWRERLYSISWFMKLLNQTISRRANEEDQCTGKFWECRFKCQALLDEMALLSCMAYVDLNPIRARIATTLEDSDFTSIQERLRKYQVQQFQGAGDDVTHGGQLNPEHDSTGLMPFLTAAPGSKSAQAPGFHGGDKTATLPFREQDYLAWLQYVGGVSLLDHISGVSCDTSTGRAVPAQIKKVFAKLDMEVWQFIETLKRLESLYPVRVGQYATLRDYADRAGLYWSRGVGHSRTLYHKKHVH